MTFFGAPWPLAMLIAVAVIYPIIARLLSNFAHPKRMRIEALGRSLLGDSRLTEAQRKIVMLSLEMNGKFWPMLLIAAILPFVLLALLVLPNFRRERKEDKEIHALRDDKRYSELQSIELGCIFAANPIAGIVVGFEIAIVATTGIVFLIGTKGIERTALRIAESIEQVLSTSLDASKGRPAAS